MHRVLYLRFKVLKEKIQVQTQKCRAPLQTGELKLQQQQWLDLCLFMCVTTTSSFISCSQ